MREIKLSDLPKTWIIDLDGVIFIHNDYLGRGSQERLVYGIKEFLSRNIKKSDVVILLTARAKKYRAITEKSLKHNKIKYDYLIMDLPKGERILMNDRKPSGMLMAYALNTKRDKVPKVRYITIKRQ